MSPPTTGTPVALSRAVDPEGSTSPERATGLRCGAIIKSTGKPCRQHAGTRTDHPGFGNCWLHFGRTPNGRSHGKQLAAAAALAKFGEPIEKDPAQALLELVWEAAGNVAFLRQSVQAMVTADTGRVGLIGDILDLTRDGDAIPVSEEVRALVKLYGEWADRLAKYAKAAVDAGIQSRIVDLVERQADLIASVVEKVIDGLELDPDRYAKARLLASEGFAALSPSLAAVNATSRN
ncbi:MAG TPA: hypothetical protein VMH41_16790 [Mycobacteriales bacterium]|nr:hypothetical protein [Mycobacteriales bacterium]